MSDQKPLPDSRRRFFLKASGATLSAGASASAAAATVAESSSRVFDLRTEALPLVRFGLIGVGQRGGFLCKSLTAIEGCRITAIADPDAAVLQRAAAYVEKAGQPKPVLYGGGERDYLKLLERKDVDAVIIATPWEWHVRMSVDAMNAGKHAFVEVPAATDIEGCWELVQTAERTRRHCMMLENVCYGREELMLLNMVRAGLFGELLHGEAAYIHDLRWQIKELERSTGSWRTLWHTRKNGNLYPTHGLGPIAQYFGINRGDRFLYLNSQSSPARSFAAYSQREFPPEHPRNKLQYINGDLNTSLIKCASGRTIMLQHDTATPRPYTRHNFVLGTNGAFGGFPARIALEYLDGKKRMSADGKHEAFHEWEHDMAPWQKRFDHPLWKKLEALALKNGGHGGMDFIMLWRIVYCLRHGLPLDQDVYDAAAWSAIFPLSCASVADRGNAKDVPDFTRGGWQSAKPWPVVDIQL
ncbi:Gfo/Idh/MocA family oxidoreductase [Massilia sp. W12]|uniref:Gfo/Idh/MocA family protein n=1 Tax=Massilia sp. W12 TaxID=3126507 RepID=UPI0030D544EC